MGEERTIIFTLSDLIQRARPLTAASSLVAGRQSSTSDTHKNSGQNYRWKPSVGTCQSPNPRTLKPLNHPTLLIGTLTLPSFAISNSPIKCSCFRFSDDSATMCCDILDFDPKMVGRKIRILAWNFIPLKYGDMGVKGGFLEIISWEFVQACSESVCSLSDFSSFCLTLGACEGKDKSRGSRLIFGMIESTSPVFVVPCANGEGDSRNICGFVLNVLVCQCKFCVSKFLVSELEELSEKNVNDHYFVKPVIVYFCGLTPSWHPVISRFIGEAVLLEGLKKKLVFIKKEESQLMYVTTGEVSLHVANLSKKRGSILHTDIRGKGECGCYTGVITGVYMQGMVVELDHDVILLLTDQHLTVPHGVRVGAIVTLKDVHFVDPKFPWGKVLILGACCRTSIRVESFSPLETGCHLKSHSQSLLQKFICSLSFAARLWVLLVISCFRKKFAGILSEKELLGSKHKEGLVQKYASLHLLPSAFQDRQGVLAEFCKHELCSGGKEEHCGHLRLVLPIANLISYFENSWNKILEDWGNSSDFVGGIDQKKPLTCGGRSYVQSTRRVLHSDKIGVLALGTLKISQSSGRLQLVDATGGIDITLDLPASWNFDRIFEAKDFTIIMEGIPPKLVDLDSTIYQPLSCQSIFCNTPPLRRMKASIYLYHCQTDEDSRSGSLFFDWKGNSQEPDNGKFHLLMITYKFPILRKFQGDLAKRSNIFAQAIVLPWDLLLAGKCDDAVMRKFSSGHWRDSLENFTRHEKHLIHKKCKIEQVSDHPLELQCLIAGKGMSCLRVGILCRTNEYDKIVSSCKPSRRKVLLEFSPDSFCMYEMLKIGRCYLVKHQEKDTLCSMKENYQVSRAKVPFSSGTHLSSVTFSSLESLRSSDVPEIPCLTSNDKDSETYSDINVFVPSGALSLLENFIKMLDGGPIEPRDSFEDESDIHQSVINASVQSSGASFSDYPLPEGRLETVRGLVVAFHDCNGDAFPAQHRPIPDEDYLPKFLQGNGGVCFHVLTNNQIVRIFFDLSKQMLPIGLGRDVYATFHRVLLLCGQKKYMMIPVSFITINDTNLKNGNLTDELNRASETVGLVSVPSPNPVPAALIFDALGLPELKPMQFRCRVVTVYMLVLEKGGSAVFQLSIHSKLSAVGIPFAGFVMDDGSSSCCCWANSESAAALLGLESEEHLLEDSARIGRSVAGTGLPNSSTIGRLNQILEQHGRVVVKNHGSIFDSSCQDLAFCVDSESSFGISESYEDLMRSLIASSLSTSWTITGSPMDPKSASQLEERLSELDMALPPLLNIWATSVCHTDVLTEARSIIKGLV